MPLPLTIASAAAAGSALVHFAVAPEHFAEWWGFGLFFVICAEVQLGWALLLGRTRGPACFPSGSPAACSWSASGSLAHRRPAVRPGAGRGGGRRHPRPRLGRARAAHRRACAWALVAPGRSLPGSAAPLRPVVVVLAVALTAWGLTAVGAA